MRPVKFLLPFIALILISVFLAACSAQTPLPGNPAGTISTQAVKTNASAPPTQKVLPTLTPSLQSKESDADKAIQSYHTVLMLERAVDLISAVIVKIDAKEIPIGDPTPRLPYTNAFLIAIDEFNKTNPPPGVLNPAWKMVSAVVGEYYNVYTVLLQGKAIADGDVVNMRIFRQFLTNFQNYAEGYLTQTGRGADFFSKEQLAVEQHFKQAYGDQPMPSLTEPGSK